MADRNGVAHHELQGLVLVHDPTCQLLARLHAFDYYDADGVVGIVDDKINAHCCSPVTVIHMP
ncbi:hypothetical protein D3C81_1962640 [compost metagenome]